MEATAATAAKPINRIAADVAAAKPPPASRKVRGSNIAAARSAAHAVAIKYVLRSVATMTNT
jgi:hypothetical protein